MFQIDHNLNDGRAEAPAGQAPPAGPNFRLAVTVTTCGRICFNRQKINLSQVFAGQTVGIKQTEDRIWLVSLWIMIWDTSTMRRAGSNPLPIPSDQKSYLCLRYET
jgi:hypothetical protein